MNPDITPDLCPGQRGSMLLSVLFIILVLAALMAGLATLSSQSSQQLVYEVQALKARLAAESVLEKQVFALLNSIDADVVSEEDDMNGCSAYIVDPLNRAEAAGIKQVNVTAVGNCDSGQLTVIRNIEVEVIE
ncbi:type IV pilus modification PilV family protein [Oceanisphaera sp. KMM 10153]|uniref:type IV pilus modification PilV family protein n=1 Tax=Oceanisphaera submarina TaxID=3390193 RepID=UPI003976D47D